MTDKLDELLLDIGREADGKVDYAALKAAVLAQGHDARIKRKTYSRYLGMAAALIALVGLGSAMLFGPRAPAAQSPMMAAPEAAMADEAAEESTDALDTTMAAEAPAEAAAPEEAAAGAAEGFAIAPQMAQSEAQASDEMRNDAGASVSAANALSSAFSPEDKLFVGVPAEGWLNELTGKAELEIQPVEPVNELEEGWAYLAPAGNYALWQTPDGTYQIFAQTDSREALTALMQSVCE